MEQPNFLTGLRWLVDILVEAFATLNRRLWVLAIPVGLDLFLWLGPRLIPDALAKRLLDLWQSLLQTAPTSLEPELVEQISTAIQQWGWQSNLFQLLSGALISTLVPKLGALSSPAAVPTWAPALAWVLLPIPLGAMALGLLLWALLMVPLADLVRQSQEGGRDMLRRAWRIWRQLLLLLVFVLFAGGVLVLVVGLVLSFATLLSPALALILTYLIGGGVFWLLFQLYFSLEAMLISGIGPAGAFLYSLQVVRSNPWLALGLIALILIVSRGTTLIWQQLALHPLGVLLGILAHSYIAAGLATARLIFYRDRLRAWLEWRKKLRARMGGQTG
ncbi:MAG: hypothetical protein JXA37_09680 [Chloroflexia bacterium]|nr:hypothetical protein [Chloroflexia bacterium]